MSDYLLPWQKEAIKEVQRSLAQVLAGGNSRGIMLLGPSGCGKTHLFDAIAAAYPPTVEVVQRITPCVRISMKSRPDAQAMSRSFLAQMGRPVRQQATVGEDTVQAAFREHKVRVVLMEEVHNSLLASEKRMSKQSGDYIKNLWNEAPNDTSTGWAGPATSAARHSMVIVVSAIEELRRAIDSDRELRSRFGTVVAAPQLALYPPEVFKQFRLVLRAMTRRFGLADFVPQEDGNLAVRLLLACDAHLRVLEEILSRTKQLRDEGDERPAPQVLGAAMAAVATTQFELANSFVLSEAELADKVAQAKKDFDQQQKVLGRRRVRT
jgi:energy-coupling factor transporter ATP-binding protein EcfA2